MNKSILKFSFLGLLALAVAGTPAMLRAQNTSATPPAHPAKTSKRQLPFHGKLKAVDNTAKTISVGTETFQITSETKIAKSGKPAMLGDAVVGDEVAGSYQKQADGKLNCTSLRIGPKPVTDSASKTNKMSKP